MIPQTTFEIVVAHYNEDLSWLELVKDTCTIYSKGEGNDALYQKLPNIGREGHTYLHHIVNRYDSLAEVTIFLQGRIDDHVTISLGEIIKRSLKTENGQVTTFPFRELELFDHWNGIPWDDYPCWKKWSSMSLKRAPKTPAQYWRQFFPGLKVPKSVAFQPGALFAVRKDTIQKHPKAFYQALLEEFFLGNMVHTNPETGHFLERFWLPMWNPSEYICWQDGDTAKEKRNKQGQLAKGRWLVTPKHVEVDVRTIFPVASKLQTPPTSDED